MRFKDEMNYELRITNYDLEIWRVSDSRKCEALAEVVGKIIYDLRFTIYDLRFTIYDLRFRRMARLRLARIWIIELWEKIGMMGVCGSASGV